MTPQEPALPPGSHVGLGQGEKEERSPGDPEGRRAEPLISAGLGTGGFLRAQAPLSRTGCWGQAGGAPLSPWVLDSSRPAVPECRVGPDSAESRGSRLWAGETSAERG